MKFTAQVEEPLRGARCDCSICSTKGAVTVGTPLDGLVILEGEDQLGCYQFNTKVAKHYFCSVCGTYTFHQRRSDPDTYGVNVACLGLNSYHDFPDVAVVDGRHHVRDTGKGRLAGRLKFEPSGD
ncbi:GFA family protein [Altererythrobacter sp. Root672]|uniref:GFA family protein n=1 Tax=Altererythrobacter sp. Root672 TaxID=1736584 RepID=UPI001F17B75B|nr:GFA family protein [Altererythrobacter sp. Root672]